MRDRYRSDVRLEEDSARLDRGSSKRCFSGTDRSFDAGRDGVGLGAARGQKSIAISFGWR